MGRASVVRSIGVSAIKQARIERKSVHALKQWLVKHGCDRIEDISIEIGGRIWYGCRYHRTLEYKASMMAVTHGDKKAGDKYEEESMYIIGELPPSYSPKRNQKVCYPYNGEDWYVAWYTDARVNKAKLNPEYHPYGYSFILAPWRIPGEAIDKYERKPYTRIPMKVSVMESGGAS